MQLRLGSPGVYEERRPRAAAPRIRTDVAGFVGFEPRLEASVAEEDGVVRRVSVRVGGGFTVELAGERLSVPAADLELWNDAIGAPPVPGEQRVHAVLAVKAAGSSRVTVVSLAGFLTAAAGASLLDPLPGAEPGDADVRAALLASDFPTAADARGEMRRRVFARGGTSRERLGRLLFPDDWARRSALAAPLRPGDDLHPDEILDAVFPADADVRAALRVLLFPSVIDWVRLGAVSIRERQGRPSPCVHPRLPPALCNDFTDVGEAFGDPADAGLQLLAMVRGFFVNGGSRCHVVTVRRPLPGDAEQVTAAVDDMIGDADDGVEDATGFARLALTDDVALADLPDLHAVHRPAPRRVRLPASEDQACFVPCDTITPGGTAETSDLETVDPWLGSDGEAVWDAQRRLVEAAILRRARIEVVLTPPWVRDGATGRCVPPTRRSALEWRERFATLRPALEDRELSTAALYWPWVWIVESRDAAPVARPPTGAVLGVIARRDLARGPYVAPANETLRGVVGVTDAPTQTLFRRFEPAEPSADAEGVGVNLLRALPGSGVQVWGSRTLSRDRWLRHLSVRRGLSALERKVVRAIEPYVFEPNTPFLWLQLTSLVVNQLMVAFRSGALRGATPEESFRVRCDETTNPPEEVLAARVWIEVAVAIAAPSEFIVFRLGRDDGAVLLEETEA